MATHGLKLAVHIIQSSFGDLVAKVCECLLRRGTLSLPQVITFTELSRDQVTNSLLVLIQHNCVQAFALERRGGFGEASKVQTQYMVLFDHIIHRMRFPKFLAIVQEELDQQCYTVLGKLLQHGRLTLPQISGGTQSENKGNSAAQDLFRVSLIKLLNAHYVERCPVGEPFLALLTEEETPAKKQGAKSSKLIKEVETPERRALAAAAPMEALRFSLIANTTIDDGEQERDNSLGVSVGEKRKHDTLESREPGVSQSEREILWRANFEEFLRRLRHKACIANVRSRMDEGAATVLSAILKATASTELKVKTEYSVPLSMNNIFEEVMKSEMGRTMTLEHVRACLIELGCPPGGRGADDLYSIDLKNIIRLAKSDEVESAVLKKYGGDAYRVFRLLSKSSRLLESDKISETTFVEKKDTGKILYELWKDNYLVMEKLAVNGSAKVFSLWKINDHGLWQHMLDDMYHSALNLRIRKAYELDQESEILGVPAETLTGTAKDKRTLVENIKVLLDSCLMKLDDAIMLFHDF